ncbi:MAG: hypothetical protein QM775_32960 [Pirellulales bacterium]
MRPTGPKLDKDGFPIPQGFDEAGVEDPARGGNATVRRIRWVLRMAPVAALLAFIWTHYDVGATLSDKIGLYFGQEALNLYDRRDLPRALVAADRAVRWSPKNAKLLEIRCKLKFANMEFDAALADAETALELKPIDLRLHGIRRTLLHYLQRHHETAVAATELLQKKLGDRIGLLNDRAYSRALGGFELLEALDDMNEVLAKEPKNASYIDTRGYVRLKLGKFDEAMEDLEKAISIVMKQRDEVEEFAVRQNPRGEFGRMYQSQMQTFDHNLAVMLHHRGEVYEKLGEQRKAEADFRAAERYGYSVEEGVY